jgi:hypothetical protein
MGRRAELFICELSDGEAQHLLKLCRRSRDPVVQHRAMLLFASFQGQNVSEIARLPRASATHVAELIHAFDGSDHASHAEQDAAIHAYLRWHRRHCRPAKPWRIKAEVHHSLPDVAASGTRSKSGASDPHSAVAGRSRAPAVIGGRSLGC